MVTKAITERLRSRWRAVGATFTLLLLVSCGIFSPRDSQPPAPNSVAQTDPFHFQSILDGTNQTFGTPQLEELFTDDFSYVDINSGSWGKNDLIQRLRQIALSSDSVQVFWEAGTNLPRDSTILLNGLKYFVYKHGDAAAAETGNSDFKIVKNQSGGNEWRISSWRDVPGTAGKSFFAPEQ